MSEFTNNIKLALMKYYEDVQFQIDIACQTIINKLKNEGLPYLDAEKRYINDFIGTLRTIEDESMKKLK